MISDGDLSVEVSTSLADFVGANPDLSVIGVDIPLDLVAAARRRADVEARSFIGVRRSSVFDALPADVLEHDTYAEALDHCRATYEKGISRQSYALRAKTMDARAAKDLGVPVVEVHPEVSFTAMAGGELPYAKKTWNGQATRLQLLAEAGLQLPEELPRATGVVPPDDIIDAAAAAWSAWRVAAGSALTLPVDPLPGEPTIWF